MSDANQFWRRFNETTDLWARVPAAFPVRRNMAALRERHEQGDPNVIAYYDEDGQPERYALEFTEDQCRELMQAYKKARGDHRLDLDYEAHVFVRTIEAWGDGLLDFYAINVPDQKVRTRSIESFAAAVEKLDSSLADMDSAALGWLYAVVADRLAASGVNVSPADDRVVSMKAHPLRAQVEAGELRKNLRQIASVIVGATTEACETLPKHEHRENDPRLKTAQALERLVIEHGISFDVNETGFAALALRSLFELGGVETEKVRYWLKKVKDGPNSFARFRERMHNKTDGENPPAD